VFAVQRREILRPVGRLLLVRQLPAHAGFCMNILRSVLVVVAGYLVFALPAFAVFRLSGRPPHAPAPLSFMLLSYAVGMSSAFIGGYLAARLARSHRLLHGAAVCAALVLGAAGSLLSTVGSGAVWSQVGALVLMAPCALLGGWLGARQHAQPSPTS